MAEQDLDNVMVHIASGSRLALEQLIQELPAGGFKAGSVREVGQVTDSHFDLSDVPGTIYQVIAVLTQVKAAIEMVEWLVNKLRQMKLGDPPLSVSVGDKRVKLANGDNPEECKKQLESLLRVQRSC
jgi:hypothetical protein